MAVREIDETELLAYEQIKGVVAQIQNNPKARALLQQAHKMVNPKAPDPQPDPLDAAVSPVKSEVAEIKAMLEADRAARADAERLAAFRSTWDNQKAQLRRAGWTDEGIEAVAAHAQERGIPDLEVAAAHYEKLHPPAEIAKPGGGGWNFFDQKPEEDKFVDAMVASRGDDAVALDREINAALTEFRSQNQAARR